MRVLGFMQSRSRANAGKNVDIREEFIYARTESGLGTWRGVVSDGKPGLPGPKLDAAACHLVAFLMVDG